jgi:hypothetical protein
MTRLQRWRLVPSAWVLAGLLPCATVTADPAAQTVDVAAFEQLKALAGRWEGTMEAPASGPASIEFEVTSNGRAVLEHQFRGTSHEMVTVYSLAYDRLQASHYCAMGNQPAYALAAGSSPRDVRMEFAGGTGFDPARDNHANGERIEVVGPDELRVEFQFRNGLEPPTAAAMRLRRVATTPAPAPAGH